MTQRMAINLLAAFCLILSAYLVVGTLTLGADSEHTWEEATRAYVEEYHSWLSQSPGSGWARVEALAADEERSRIEMLKGELHGPSGWRYAGGDFHLLLQAGGKALAEASYRLEGSGEVREVRETYLLEKTVRGIKVVKVMGGGQE